MPRALCVPCRQEIVRRHCGGESLTQISEALNLSYWSVRGICRRYRDRGEDGLKPDYDRCKARPLRSDRKVHRAALWLKRRHPQWGAGLIRTLISERWPDRPLPHPRTFQRWFRAARLHRVRQRRLRSDPQWAKEPHEVWQMDAVEKVRLADGNPACWLTLTDEATGAILSTAPFPPGTDRLRGTGSGPGGAGDGLPPVGRAEAAAGG